MEKDAADNEAKGKEYREKFAKEKGVKTSSTGLVYQVVEAGKGEAPKDSDTVVVNYKGTLIDGKSSTTLTPVVNRFLSVWTVLSRVGQKV